MIGRPHLRALSIGELLDTSFRLYRSNFLTFITIVALVLVPYNVLTFVLSAPVAPTLPRTANIDIMIGFLRRVTDNNESGWFGFFYSVVLQPIMYATLMLTAAQLYQRQPASARDHFRAARGRWRSLIGAHILFYLMLLLALLPPLAVAFCILIPFVDFLASSGYESLGTPSVLIIAGIFLLPLLYMTLRLNFIIHAMMLEGHTARESIARSWNLSRNNLWRLLGLTVTIILLGLCLTTFPVGAIIYGLSLVGVDGQLIVALQEALVTIAQILVEPFTSIVYTLMFFDLRIRNEGYDLEQHNLLAPRSDDGDYQPSLST